MLEVHAILQRQRCNENITKKTGTLSDAYGEPLTYQMNASSREVFQKNSKWDYTASTGSAWQMQLGVKFTF